MSGQLHEVLAVYPSTKGAATKLLAETLKTFKDKKHLFAESLKTYRHLIEDEAEHYQQPEEHSVMGTTVGQKLAHMAEFVGPFIDAGLQIDLTNTAANADVEVEGLTLPHLPATFLMQFDKRLGELRKAYDEMPTLDPKRRWAEDPARGQGVYTADAEVTHVTRKETKYQTVAEATEHHPAQIATDVVVKRVGENTTKFWSGMVTPREKKGVIARLDALQKAVKRALAEANRIDHSTDKIAEKVFKYIHGGLV